MKFTNTIFTCNTENIVQEWIINILQQLNT